MGLKELNDMSESDDVKNKRINQIVDEIYELEVDKLKNGFKRGRGQSRFK